MTVWPPIVNVPVRGLPVAFCATENVTEPIPDPAPLVIVIQLVVVVAVHEHDVPVRTLSVCVDGVPATEKLVGFSLGAKAAMYVGAFVPEITAIVSVDPHVSLHGDTN